MNIGDLVSVLDEDLKGKIVAIGNKFCTIEDDHGFTYEVEKSKIVPQNHSIYDGISVLRKSEIPKNQSKKHKNSPEEIDLHFEQLVKNPQQYEAWERLAIQKEKLIEKIEYCRKNNLKKLNIIHGIGDGVLQNMVHDVLQGIPYIDFENHDFFLHSSGNTLVNFR